MDRKLLGLRALMELLQHERSQGIVGIAEIAHASRARREFADQLQTFCTKFGGVSGHAAGLANFKTGALNHSATRPSLELLGYPIPAEAAEP